MSRVSAVQRLLGFVGIHWQPEPIRRACAGSPGRGRARWPDLWPGLRRALAFVGVWLDPPGDPRPRRSP